MQIFDRRTIAIPGPMGNVTPEAQAARDQAVQARADAIAARDEAETFAAGTVALQDAAIASRVADPGSATHGALDGTTADLISSDSAARRAVIDLAQNVALGGPFLSSPLARLRQGIVDSSLSTRVVVLGSSTFAGYGISRAGASVAERLAYRAGATSFPSLDTVTATPTGGMLWFQGAVGGTHSGNYLPQQRVDKVAIAEPHYAIHAVGSNDWALQTPLATYEANMRAAVEAIEAAVPGVVNVLVHQQARYDNLAPSISWDSYGQVLAAVAAENPTQRVFINADAYMDVLSMGRGNRWDLIGPDEIHMTDAGHRLLADILSAHLGIPTERAVGEQRYDMTIASGNFTTRTVIASRTFGAASYPRIVTMKAQAFVRQDAGTGDLTLHRIDSTDTVIASWRVGDAAGQPAHVPTMDVEVYLPPGVDVTLALDAYPYNAASNVYVSGNATFTNGQWIVRPY